MDEEERGGGDEEGEDEDEDPFMTVPVEVVFHILACLVRPTPTPSRGDDYGGPYEAAVESAVQLVRLQQVRSAFRFRVRFRFRSFVFELRGLLCSDTACMRVCAGEQVVALAGAGRGT
jgi:hypothetical protein